MNHDMALPHGGLLAFFCRNKFPRRMPDNETSPPPYDYGMVHSIDVSTAHNDEESISGFWGESGHEQKHAPCVKHLNIVERGYHGAYTFCCFWFAIFICILGAFGAFFVIDLAFTRLGMGTGMATWMVHRNVGRGVPNYEVRKAQHVAGVCCADMCHFADELLPRHT